MSNEKNINTNVEKKDATVVAHEIKGELTYEDKVIQKIIGLSLENVSGLLGIDGGFFSNLKEKIVNSDDVTSGVNVEVGKTQVAVDLNIIAEYQKNVPALYSMIVTSWGGSACEAWINGNLIKSDWLKAFPKLHTPWNLSLIHISAYLELFVLHYAICII